MTMFTMMMLMMMFARLWVRIVALIIAYLIFFRLICEFWIKRFCSHIIKICLWQWSVNIQWKTSIESFGMFRSNHHRWWWDCGGFGWWFEWFVTFISMIHFVSRISGRWWWSSSSSAREREREKEILKQNKNNLDQKLIDEFEVKKKRLEQMKMARIGNNTITLDGWDSIMKILYSNENRRKKLFESFSLSLFLCLFSSSYFVPESVVACLQ